MQKKSFKALSLAVAALVLLAAFPLGSVQSQTQDYTVSFQLLNHVEGDVNYQLNVTVPQNLLYYYGGRSHALYSASDFVKFVTPYALKPIADRLWQIYNNTEDFTNGVLMLVHQITYQEIDEAKYPVETLVAGYGDCDLFTYIAASILEAGGINTVLVYYKEKQHMEIGVDLGSVPTETRTNVYDMNYGNVSYYIGETTGTNWRNSWRVGECPGEFQNISAQVITLQGMEQASIDQVLANLRELDPSTITLQVTPSLTLGTGEVNVSGQILPQEPNENVTLQAKINGPTWTTIGTVVTDENGQFEYNWTPQTGGSISFQASWMGNKEYNGAKSVQAELTVLSTSLVALIATTVVGVAVFLCGFVFTRKRKPRQQLETAPTNPLPPSPPPENSAAAESTGKNPLNKSPFTRKTVEKN